MSGTDTAVDTIVDRLCQHRTLGKAPREELEWIAAHSFLRTLDRGDIVAHKGDSPDRHGMYIVLSGGFAIYVDRGAGPRKVYEWRAGDLSGVLPFSRMTSSPGETITEEPTEILLVRTGHFPEMIRECPTVTAICVHAMLDRARAFTSNDLHDEKMVSLGRLAAGLAHELNNPASAVARSAKVLADSQDEADAAASTLVAAHLTDSQLALVTRLRDRCVSSRRESTSPIELADREDAIADWLAAHGADVSPAAALAETALTVDDLDDLAASLPPETLAPALRWIAARCTTHGLTSDIERAAMRIYDLVAAVKGFTQMDRPAVPEPVDIAPGLRDTVAVLGAKARDKSVRVDIDLAPDVPPVRAASAELNQVWINLIDNALDAAPESGRVTISARREQGAVVVRIVDNGPGIPDEIKGRVFDPFFTTKPVGQGTGLGLEIVRRIMRLIAGDVKVESRPGHTEFIVSLPAVVS